ncbi:MAG: glycoside hydrolase [Candidatus Magnetoovum sp. WYHC-5]|nr:glycoside hydrolase [Candidatus Magnetoovum sp. WYHC-5]
MLSKRIFIPQAKNLYPSFPTFTEWDEKVYIFYRMGIKDESQPHGLYGKVICTVIEKKQFLDYPALTDLASGTVVFESANELDAIVSKVDSAMFTLCTRTYVKGKIGKTYMSVSESPEFSQRIEVCVKGVEWLVFYGKAFRADSMVVFPAYGVLSGQQKTCPLVIATEDFKGFHLLSYIKEVCQPDIILNENTIVHNGRQFLMFIRQDNPPFGLWYCTSTELIKKWSMPKKLVENAHAPMAFNYNDKTLLLYRGLINKKSSTVMLSTVVDNNVISNAIDTYDGNPYDGGYGDIGIIDNRLFVIYYLGNVSGEPCIKVAEII